MQGPDLVCDPEQIEYQDRPMTPGEKEIMSIYEDGIFRPPDMIEKPGVLQIKGSGIGTGRSRSLQICCRSSRLRFSEVLGQNVTGNKVLSIPRTFFS